MAIKGTLDPAHVDREMQAMLRESGEYVSPGWYGIDDNLKRHIGPYSSRDACQKACDDYNS